MQIPNPSQNPSAAMGDLTLRPSRPFPRAIAALQHRNFRLFWGGQLISLIGTWMDTTGQAWLVLELTRSSWWLGLVGALQFLPVLLLGLFGRVIADRFPKRRLLLFTQSFTMFQAALLSILVVTHTIQLWHVFILASLLGITSSLDMPARQSFVVEMVGREDLPNAIALNSTVFNMARIIGPAIAGLIIAGFGEAPLFMLNAFSFIPVIISLARIDQSQLHAQPVSQRDTERQGTFASLHEGLRYVRHMPAVLLIILMVGIISLFGVNFNVVLPLIADIVLKAGPEGFGFVSAAFGVGALLAALWLAWNSKGPSIKHIVVSALIFTISEALFALSHWYMLSLVLIAIVGFAMISFAAMANTTLQTVTPDRLRGRIMSVYLLVFNGSTPIGNLFTGALASKIGISLALFICAIVSLMAAFGGWILRGPAEKSVKEFKIRV